MSIATQLSHLSLLFFLIISVAAASTTTGDGVKRPLIPTADLIHQWCKETEYYDLCISTLVACPHNSSVVDLEMGKLAFCAVLASAKSTREQLSKLMIRGDLNPTSKHALRECGKQYDMAIYELVLAENYINSDEFSYYKYTPVLFSVQDAGAYFIKCGEMLKGQRGLVEPFTQKNEIAMHVADNADYILFDLVDYNL